MNASVSPNTQAILLLTAPLMVPGGRDESAPLQPREYKRLAQWLHSNGLQPASLLESDAALIDECGVVVESDRLRALLDRGFRMADVLDRWQARSIWVVSRGDDMYPEALRRRLKGNAPPLLYGCGPMSLLGGKGFAVVGPRDAGDVLLRYAEDAAELAARAAFTVVSGGAKGVDRAAMNGALGGGGRVAGVLPGGLERAVVNREHRALLLDQRLVLVSLSDPRAGFQVGYAMARNKLIYALADATLVVDATEGKGGTWAGAQEQLRRDASCVYVRSTLDPSPGLEALLGRGARPWPDPERPEDLEALLTAPTDGPASAEDDDGPGGGSREHSSAKASPEEAQVAAQLEMFGGGQR